VLLLPKADAVLDVAARPQAGRAGGMLPEMLRKASGEKRTNKGRLVPKGIEPARKVLAMARCRGYRFGVRWIADNDEVLETDPEAIAAQISTLFLADMFDKDPAKVAADVARARKKQKQT
jgi:hypothetical protein